MKLQFVYCWFMIMFTFGINGMKMIEEEGEYDDDGVNNHYDKKTLTPNIKPMTKTAPVRHHFPSSPASSSSSSSSSVNNSSSSSSSFNNSSSLLDLDDPDEEAAANLMEKKAERLCKAKIICDTLHDMDLTKPGVSKRCFPVLLDALAVLPNQRFMMPGINPCTCVKENKRGSVCVGCKAALNKFWIYRCIKVWTAKESGRERWKEVSRAMRRGTTIASWERENFHYREKKIDPRNKLNQKTQKQNMWNGPFCSGLRMTQLSAKKRFSKSSGKFEKSTFLPYGLGRQRCKLWCTQTKGCTFYSIVFGVLFNTCVMHHDLRYPEQKCKWQHIRMPGTRRSFIYHELHEVRKFTYNKFRRKLLNNNYLRAGPTRGTRGTRGRNMHGFNPHVPYAGRRSFTAVTEMTDNGFCNWQNLPRNFKSPTVIQEMMKPSDESPNTLDIWIARTGATIALPKTEKSCKSLPLSQNKKYLMYHASLAPELLPPFITTYLGLTDISGCLAFRPCSEPNRDGITHDGKWSFGLDAKPGIPVSLAPLIYIKSMSVAVAGTLEVANLQNRFFFETAQGAPGGGDNLAHWSMEAQLTLPFSAKIHGVEYNDLVTVVIDGSISFYLHFGNEHGPDLRQVLNTLSEDGFAGFEKFKDFYASMTASVNAEISFDIGKLLNDEHHHKYGEIKIKAGADMKLKIDHRNRELYSYTLNVGIRGSFDLGGFLSVFKDENIQWMLKRLLPEFGDAVSASLYVQTMITFYSSGSFDFGLRIGMETKVDCQWAENTREGLWTFIERRPNLCDNSVREYFFLFKINQGRIDVHNTGLVYTHDGETKVFSFFTWAVTTITHRPNEPPAQLTTFHGPIPN